MNMRKRVVPGAYVGAGAQGALGGTAYCVAEKGGELSSDNDRECVDGEAPGNNVEFAGFTVMLGASNTVRIGTMQGVAPTFLSEQMLSAR